LDYDGKPFDVFNVSAADSIGREEVLPRFERVYGRLPEIRNPARFEADAYASVLDSSRARERLGWEPRGDWNSIVDKQRITNQKDSRQ
jgi:nucleoside-diphosphate-sugar epimerase